MGVCRERPQWRSVNTDRESIGHPRNATEGVPYRRLVHMKCESYFSFVPYWPAAPHLTTSQAGNARRSDSAPLSVTRVPLRLISVNVLHCASEARPRSVTRVFSSDSFTRALNCGKLATC